MSMQEDERSSNLYAEVEEVEHLVKEMRIDVKELAHAQATNQANTVQAFTTLGNILIQQQAQLTEMKGKIAEIIAALYPPTATSIAVVFMKPSAAATKRTT